MNRFRNVCRLLWGWVRDTAAIVAFIALIIFGLNVAADWNAARKAIETSQGDPQAVLHSASLLIPMDDLSHRNPVLWI